MAERLKELGMQKPFFLDFVVAHPALVDPILHYQKAIKTKLFGMKYWKQVSMVRDKLSGERGWEPIDVIVERITPTKKGHRQRRRSSSNSITGSTSRRCHTDGESDSSSSDEDPDVGSGCGSVTGISLVKVKSQSSLGTKPTGGGRRSRLSRGSQDSFSSDGGSERHSKRGSFDKHSVGSLCDEEPAVPRVDRITGKIRWSFGSEGGSLVDDNEWDAFDRKIAPMVGKAKSLSTVVLSVEGEGRLCVRLKLLLLL